MNKLERIEDILRTDLWGRVNRVDSMSESAKSLLKEGDLFQASVRLEEAAKECRFTPLLQGILDIVSTDQHGG